MFTSPLSALLVMQYLVRALLCLCSAVAVVVSSQQLRDVPYVHFMGVNLTNHSYVDIFDISDDESTGHLECRTDLQTCCHSSDGDDRGSWFHPNGEVLPRAFLNPIGLYFFRRTQSINMRFRGTAVPSDSGIYQCTIETNAVNSADNTAREIVYVGIYESGGISIAYSTHEYSRHSERKTRQHNTTQTL